MSISIRLLRDTSSGWAYVNPILADGEQGLETDTGRIKIGSGFSTWLSLPYHNPGGSIPQSQVYSLETDLGLKAPLASPTFTGTATAADLTIAGTTRVKPILETVSVVVSAFAGYTYDVKTSTIKYLVVPSTNNGVVNFRGNSSTTLTSMMTTGEALTVTLMITNNVAYGVSSVTIDGSSPNSFRWLGGTVPTKSSGAVDVYSFTIMKTGSSTFDVFASMSKFA